MNLDQLRFDIQNLLLQYPELAEDDVLREDTLDGVTDFREALSGIVRRIDNAMMLKSALNVRIDELKQRRERFDLRIDRLRELTLSVLQSANLKKLELPEVTLSQRAGLPQIVGEPDVDQLPDDLVRIRREPNRTAIREALLAHRELPGLSLSNAPPSLVVKMK